MNTKETQSTGRKRRARTTAAVAMLLVLIMVAGTFAWQNYRQHKTNDALLGGLFYKATLVEEFDRTKAQDWKVTDPELVKRVSVLNPGNTESPGDNKDYGDIYTRIQLKEFMEFYPVTQQYTPDRYMIDKNGKFISFSPKENYKILVGPDGWPVAEATSQTPDNATVFAGGQAAAAEFARLVGVKADNDTYAPHSVGKQRIFFTPFETDSVSENQASLMAWLARYNALNDASLTLTDITLTGGAAINPDSIYFPKGIIDPVNGLDDKDLPWYIQTKQKDPNGVYGNFICIDGQIDYVHKRNMLIDSMVPGTADFLQTSIPDKASESQKKSPNGAHDEWINSAVDIGYTLDQVNGECLYTVHQWVDGQHLWNVNGPGRLSYFDYIGWVFGKDVVLFSDWDGSPCNKWIIDDRASGNDEGWVYWGAPLSPGEQTSNFLEALALLSQSDDRAYYALHIDMQALSYDELYRWEESNDTSGNSAIVSGMRKGGMKVLAVTIMENPIQVGRGMSFAFTANVVGSVGVNKDVVWTLNAYNGGSVIDSDGLLHVGSGETNGTLTVRATSVHDTSKYDEWTVSIVDVPIVNTLAVGPDTATALIQQALTFTATETFVSGASATTGVTWSVEHDDNTDVDLDNIILTVNPADPMQVIITVKREEVANVGKTFKVVATSNDVGLDGQPVVAEAIVTIHVEIQSPVVKTQRYIKAADAGDTSDWIEIARTQEDGFSLIVRKSVIGVAANDVNSYLSSPVRTAINNWFNGTSTLAGNAPLRSFTVANTAVQNNFGTFGVPGGGISMPTAAFAGTGNDIAFALSFGEAASFCSRLYSDTVTSPSGARANFEMLTMIGNPPQGLAALRTADSINTRLANLALFVSGMYRGNAGHSNEIGNYSVLPALWIDAYAAENAGLFSSR